MMINQLATIAKQTGAELITVSDTLADEMCTWADLLAEDPDMEVATFSAGFISNPSETHNLELVIDVQAPLDQTAVLRTWAIEALTDDDGKESFNNIQLTFEADNRQAHRLITKGTTISREDIRQLLRHPSTQLAHIIVSKELGGDGTQQTHGERYDYGVDDLSDDLDEVVEVNNALQMVLQKLKQAPTKDHA